MSGPAVSATCTVCNHPDVDLVNAEINLGLPRRAIARRHEPLKHDAVNRHWWHRHPGVTLPHPGRPPASAASGPAAQPEPEEALPAGATPRERLQAIAALYERRRAAGTLRADEARELRLLVVAIDQMGGGEPPAVTSWRDVDGWEDLECRMYAALEPFPEARLALSAALQVDDPRILPQDVDPGVDDPRGDAP